ncbi:hypothetical protein HanPI659440_Chr01g0018041 [Helianthus annuus]|nr:hypothetical protein HanPI659440_Chr01g0018041 [Helianthus annuus]
MNEQGLCSYSFILTKRMKFLVRVRLYNKRTNTNKFSTERFTNCSAKRSVCFQP